MPNFVENIVFHEEAPASPEEEKERKAAVFAEITR